MLKDSHRKFFKVQVFTVDILLAVVHYTFVL